MIRVAICDDDKILCHELEQKIYKIFDAKKCIENIDIDIFFSGQTLFRYLEFGNRYDVIFLDVITQKVNGIIVANAIRDKLEDEDTQIVYISTQECYTMEIFSARPLNFLVKPISSKALEYIIKKTIYLKKKNQALFEYRINHHMHCVAYKEIVYFEVRNRQIYIHMKKGVVSYYGTLSNVREKVKNNRFLAVSRSELIHYDAIEQYNFDRVHLIGNIIIIISPSRRKDVQEQMNYYMKKDNYIRNDY